MKYTGIGSRDISLEEKEYIHWLSQIMSKLDYTLYSGGAEGSDTAFEQFTEKKEIFIPWKGFNNRTEGIVPEFTDKHIRMVQRIHPKYEELSEGAKKLHYRNVNQIAGKDLKSKSSLVIYCSTPKVEVFEGNTIQSCTGGTRTAVVLAHLFKIPAYNIRVPEDRENLLAFLLNQSLFS